METEPPSWRRRGRRNPGFSRCRGAIEPHRGRMRPKRFGDLTKKYRGLRIAVVGDFCLDRYLEIDPLKQEISIETGLAVHNVLNVRSQPGAAGTVLNNLVAL